MTRRAVRRTEALLSALHPIDPSSFPRGGLKLISVSALTVTATSLRLHLVFGRSVGNLARRTGLRTIRNENSLTRSRPRPSAANGTGDITGGLAGTLAAQQFCPRRHRGALRSAFGSEVYRICRYALVPVSGGYQPGMLKGSGPDGSKAHLRDPPDAAATPGKSDPPVLRAGLPTTPFGCRDANIFRAKSRARSV